MRITNKMMTNNMLHNINTNKNNMSNLENKYASGMEIQKPSDDPIVAVRALKLRSNLSELNQYYQKNIPDAMSWMEVTENSLKNTSEIITQIHTYCDQGANDTLTVSERDSIVQNLLELKNQIYQEGNANYAGRYLFTGFKTNTGLIFDKQERNLQYTITEEIEASEIDISDRIVDSLKIEDYDTAAELDALTDTNTLSRPSSNTIFRIRLSYDNISDIGSLSVKKPRLDPISGIQLTDSDGKKLYDDVTTIPKSGMTIKNSNDPDAYKPNDNEIIFLQDTGEIILGKDNYDAWRNYKFEVTYDKNSFEKNELRPEHYFNCTAQDLTITDPAERAAKAVTYTVEDQEIKYEVNFNQTIAINVQGRDAFRHSLGRSIDDIVKSISDVNAVKEKIAKVDKMLNDTSLTEAQKAKLQDINKILKSELELKDSMMRQAYGRGLTAMDSEEDAVNAATSDIGTRYNRLELTEDRLAMQQVEFTDLLSQNEDADLVDTIVNYNSANTVYNASLQAAGKVVKTTLLDFL
ncbi:MAG: flagellar hook-associated protein FlgL [Lachnospiraceae bacterium]|nr:flagellar hook-associated protein FlgL [Lachnospiraceae bacterium]